MLHIFCCLTHLWHLGMLTLKTLCDKESSVGSNWVQQDDESESEMDLFSCIFLLPPKMPILVILGVSEIQIQLAGRLFLIFRLNTGQQRNSPDSKILIANSDESGSFWWSAEFLIFTNHISNACLLPSPFSVRLWGQRVGRIHNSPRAANYLRYASQTT